MGVVKNVGWTKIDRNKGGAKSDGFWSLPIGLVCPTSKLDLGVMPFKICTVHAARAEIDQNLTNIGDDNLMCRCSMISFAFIFFARFYFDIQDRSHNTFHLKSFKGGTARYGHYISIYIYKYTIYI